MNEQLKKYLKRFNKEQLINVLWASLTQMEDFPDSGKIEAVMLAIGAETVEKDNEPQWLLPPVKDAVINTAPMGIQI